MRKDIEAINEAYTKSKKALLTEGFNESAALKALLQFNSDAQHRGAYGDLDYNKIIELLRTNSGNIEDVVHQVGSHYYDEDGGEVNIDDELESLQAALENIVSSSSEDEEHTDDTSAAPTIGEDTKQDAIFYRTWESIIDNLSDEALEATMYMIKNFNELNNIVKEEYRYRNSGSQM